MEQTKGILDLKHLRHTSEYIPIINLVWASSPLHFFGWRYKHLGNDSGLPTKVNKRVQQE